MQNKFSSANFNKTLAGFYAKKLATDFCANLFFEIPFVVTSDIFNFAILDLSVHIQF